MPYDPADLDLARDLAEWAAEDGPPPDWRPGDDVEPPETRDPYEANRMLRRLAIVDAETARLQAFAEREIAMMTAWAQDRLAGLDRQRDWLARSLEGWARANWSKPDSGHTWKFPHGEVSLRKAQPRLVPPTDPDAVEKVLPGAVKREPKVVASVVKALATAPGEDGKPVYGPVVGPVDADGYEPHAVMTADGETVPGAVLLVPTRLGFTAKPAAPIAEPEPEVEQ